MSDLQVFKDAGLEEEVEGVLEFDPVMAGETVERSIYLKNSVDFPMEVELVLFDESGEERPEDVFVSTQIESLEANAVEEVVLRFEVDMARMEPVKGFLDIEYAYLVS